MTQRPLVSRALHPRNHDDRLEHAGHPVSDKPPATPNSATTSGSYHDKVVPPNKPLLSLADKLSQVVL